MPDPFGAIEEFHDAAKAARQVGYNPAESLDPREPSYRFVRGSQVIDIMAPDVGTGVRFGGRPVLAAAGSGSALRNTEPFRTPAGTLIRIPDVTAALSLKGAASGAVSGNPVRHAQDGIVLFACVGAVGGRIPSKSERANISRPVRRFDTPEARSLADDRTRHLAMVGITSVRPDWNAPGFQVKRRGLR